MEKLELLQLLSSAFEIRKNCYAPYSDFRVGCAVLLDDGRVIHGVNVENASYSVTICAERTALSHITTLGMQNHIKAVAIASQSSPAAAPCGVCRQMLQEFLSDETPIIMGNEAGEHFVTTMKEILPHAFKPVALKKDVSSSLPSSL